MDAIDRIRAFNRAWTGRLGLLGRSYLGSGLGLTEVRVLHDLDQPAPVQARALALALGIDEGQLSRTLKRFEAAGWICRRPAAGDRRQREIALTAAGRDLAAALKARARDDLGRRMADLAPGARERLAALLGEAGALLAGAPVGLRDLRPGDAGWITARHGALYAEDEGYDASFEALVAEILAAFLRGRDPARERGWIAERAGTPLGSIFCMRESNDVARLRLFFVERPERGTGLAQRMLDACLDFARAAGYRRMTLWTHESHRAAGRLYARNGFALTATRAARSFGQDTVEQEWERDL